MTTPTIHLNGTSREALEAAYRKAYDALYPAMDALRETAPNARDYYPQGPEAVEAAQDEHIERMRKIEDVYREITALIVSVMDVSAKRG